MAGFDTPAHYLSWQFFRHTPWRQWPMGINRPYGMDAPGSIVLADGIPVVAFILKPVSAWLPADFQYFGLWILSCFVLQAWFGYKLMTRVCEDFWLRLLGSGFFLCATVFLMRTCLHPALSAQWVLLAGIYLALDERPRELAWLALLWFVALVHAYLFVMVGTIWLFNWAGRVLHRRELRGRLLAWAAGITLLVILNMWAAGYFVAGALSPMPVQGGTNLLFPLWTGGCIAHPWSRFIPCQIFDWRGSLHAGDGFGYFGLGFLLLVPLALVLGLKARQTTSTRAASHAWPWLFLGGLLLLLFAIGPDAYLGRWRLWSFGSPEWLSKISGVFRSAARMEWVMWYLILLATLRVTVSRLGKSAARIVLGVALVVQCVDLSAAAHFNRKQLSHAPYFRDQLTDPVWDELAGKYGHVVYLQPSGVMGATGKKMTVDLIAALPNYRQTAHAAGLRGQTINIAYLARVDQAALDRARARRDAWLPQGLSEPSTYYVVDDDGLWQSVLCAPSHGQWHGRIDQLRVLIPEASSLQGLPASESCPNGPKHGA